MKLQKHQDSIEYALRQRHAKAAHSNTVHRDILYAREEAMRLQLQKHE